MDEPVWYNRQYYQWFNNQEIDVSHVRELFIDHSVGPPRNTVIPDTIDRFVNLRELYLRSLSITSMSESIYNLRNLEILHINNCNINSISNNIGNLVRLKELDLANNELRRIPDTIGALLNLKKLYLTNNNLINIPTTICNLINLQELVLDDNQLIELPECLGNLANLLLLSISGNTLRNFPEAICNIITLEELNIYNTGLTRLPDCLRNLVNLTSLNIADNYLGTFPETICNLTNLQNLSMFRTGLTTVPECIGNLVNLNYLSIIDNNIRELPSSFTRLTKLEIFDYDEDRIRLPEDFHLAIPDENNNDYRNNTNNNNAVRNYNNLAHRGRAFQIHNAFDRIDKNGLIAFFKEKNSIETNEAFINYLYETFKGFINTLEDKETATRNFQTIYDRILSKLEYTSEQKQIFSLALEYVKRQPTEFIQNYVSNYINDIINAYNGGRNRSSGMSCAKGAIERIITSIIPAAMLYAHKNEFRDKGYNRLLTLITQESMRNIRNIFRTYSQECYQANPEDVSAFKECIKSKARAEFGERYNNASTNAELGPLTNSLRMYGGRRKLRKTRKVRKSNKKNRKSTRRR